ncbi:MAG: Ig-like domain-containing protein [Oscillospiraceae bacterium]|nr:Ig-like domain-containing protein [Oscillospiraceae bacterium]
MNENNKSKKTSVIIAVIVCVLILAAVGLTIFFLLNREEKPLLSDENETAKTSESIPDGFKLEIIPTRNTPEGIEIDTEFIVRTSSSMKISELTDCLAIKNGENYKLRESGTEREYIMSPGSLLKYDSIYRIEFKSGDDRAVSFAFQTVENFKVVGTTPGSETYNIPLKSGIEITFNERIEGGFRDYFTITPYVSGKIENVGNTYIFIPDSLMPNTRYEITVKKGIKSAESGKVLEEDYNFYFWTQWDNIPDSVSISGDAYETFLPDDEIFVELYAAGVFLEKTYNVEIYELNNSDTFEYLNAEKLYRESAKELSDLKFIGSLETRLLNIENENYYSYVSNSYIMLDQTLPNGRYLIKITTENADKIHELYKFIQVSPLSVYSAAIDGEMLFWINDAATGQPAAGAEIAAGQSKIVTDGDGLAVLKTPQTEMLSVTVNYADYPAFVYMTDSRTPAVLDMRSRYYHYVYTDRKAYRPTDTIDVFGVMRERYGEYKITRNDRITLKIGNMTEIPLTLDKYGSFNVKIPISDMKGYLSLEIYFNGEYVDSEYVNIVDYDNAKYLIDAATDRFAYRPGETAEVGVSVETYDGAPVEGLEIMRNTEIVGMTDDSGKAAVTEYAQKYSWNSSWQPYTNSFYYNIGRTENKIQYVSVPYVFIPSDIMLEHEIVSGSEIAFTSNFIEREAIEQAVEESWYNVYWIQPDLYRGDSVDINFTVEVHKREYIRTKIGERYDYINKVNVPKYEYSTSDTVYGTYNYKTINGKISVTGLPVSDDSYVYYYAIINYNDTEGNPIEFRIWYGGYSWRYDYQSSIKNYYFDVHNSDNQSIYSLRLNETGYVKLNDYNNDSREIVDGKILAVLCHSKNAVVSKNIGSPNGTPITFTEDCIFNVRVIGAYFDGKYIYPITYGRDITYDYSEKTLDFDFSFDKESYAPGDEVTAEIKVTDENGKPKKTLVNLSVVDESVFAEYENYANMPSRYYYSIYSYIYYTYYASYTQHEFLTGGGAEMGDGGSGDYMMRKDFTDNPAFISVETDDNGIAKITFELAEKITSWRVTVHGVTEDNFVGNAKQNIISSLPFAVDLVMNNEYIIGDDISVTVKPQGRQYKYNQTDVSYTVEILSAGSVVASNAGTSKSAFAFNAGKLPEGNYTIRVTAETDSYGDGMEKEFSVIKSGVLLPLTARDIISESNANMRKYDIKTSPVRVTIYNYDMSFIMKTLRSCVSYSSRRTDYIAANVFYRRFIDSIYKKEPLNISQTDYNGADLGYAAWKSELVYGSSDILYSARFYACFPESAADYNKKEIRKYVYTDCLLYNDNKKRLKNMTPEFKDNEYLELNRAAGYLTLAALGDTVLLEIYEQINIIYNSADQAKFTESYQSCMRVLYYAAALTALGDDIKAGELMERYKPSEKLYNKTSDKATRDMWREYINTLTLYINTRIDQDEAYRYLREMENEPNQYVSDVCEKINFVRYFTFKGGTRSEIEYTLGNATRKAVFENYDMLELTLTKEQFDALNVKHISGNTEVYMSFYGTPENLDAQKNKISIEKQILSSDEFRKQFNNYIAAEEEFAYYIVFKINLPARGYYTIYDRLPGNMRYLNTNLLYSGNYYVNNPEKQFVNISVYTESGGEITVVYNASKISDADAVTEKAYISSSWNFDVDSIWGASK